MARVLTTRRRKLLRAFRSGVGESPDRSGPRPPDPTLLELVDEPFVSPTDARDRLAALENTLRDREDRRAIFLTIYARVTGAVVDRINRGGFRDPPWVADYLVRFADYYRRAFAGFERGESTVPAPWRHAFLTARSGEALVVQDAFLGINAHINHDLALALADVGIDPERATKYNDHRAVSEVLGSLVDESQSVLAEYYAPGLATLDVAAKRFDETISFFTIDEARENAWKGAVALTRFDGTPLRRAVRWYLSVTTLGAAHFVLAPNAAPAVLDALRAAERAGTPDRDGV